MHNLSSDQAILRINLAALQKNYRYFVEQAPHAQTAAVVKADAYGLGVAHIVPALVEAGCQCFFVAQAHEGVELRDILNNIKANGEIYVLNGYAHTMHKAFKSHALRPCLGNLEEIKDWQKDCGHEMPAALHIDTGFNRLGIHHEDIPKLPENFTPCLVMSHLACADTPAHAMNAQQCALFQHICQSFEGATMSLANSAGTLLGESYHFDMVRIGIGLYGGSPTSPTSGDSTAGAPVISVQAPILQIRNVSAGETIGYGATYKVETDCMIAIISIGYADGYLRLLRHENRPDNAAHIVINKQKCPLVGRISMDFLAADITHIADSVKRGDMVELIGPHIKLEELANHAETISYEILTRLGTRFKRVYDKN